MSEFIRIRITTNRGEFNRLYKTWLEQHNKIYCSRCKYHKNENRTTKGYGGYADKKVKHPSWKLTSKNKKQWMYKKLNFKPIDSRFYDWSEITW